MRFQLIYNKRLLVRHADLSRRKSRGGKKPKPVSIEKFGTRHARNFGAAKSSNARPVRQKIFLRSDETELPGGKRNTEIFALSRKETRALV